MGPYMGIYFSIDAITNRENYISFFEPFSETFFINISIIGQRQSMSHKNDLGTVTFAKLFTYVSQI